MTAAESQGWDESAAHLVDDQSAVRAIVGILQDLLERRTVLETETDIARLALVKDLLEQARWPAVGEIAVEAVPGMAISLAAKMEARAAPGIISKCPDPLSAAITRVHVVEEHFKE